MFNSLPFAIIIPLTLVSAIPKWLSDYLRQAVNMITRWAAAVPTTSVTAPWAEGETQAFFL